MNWQDRTLTFLLEKRLERTALYYHHRGKQLGRATLGRVKKTHGLENLQGDKYSKEFMKRGKRALIHTDPKSTIHQLARVAGKTLGGRKKHTSLRRQGNYSNLMKGMGVGYNVARHEDPNVEADPQAGLSLVKAVDQRVAAKQPRKKRVQDSHWQDKLLNLLVERRATTTITALGQAYSKLKKLPADADTSPLARRIGKLIRAHSDENPEHALPLLMGMVKKAERNVGTKKKRDTGPLNPDKLNGSDKDDEGEEWKK